MVMACTLWSILPHTAAPPAAAESIGCPHAATCAAFGSGRDDPLLPRGFRAGWVILDPGRHHDRRLGPVSAGRRRPGHRCHGRRATIEEVALLIVCLALVIWVPHGNLLPYVLDILDLKRFGVRLQGRIAVRSLRMALLNPANVSETGPGELTAGHAQPALVEGRGTSGGWH